MAASRIDAGDDYELRAHDPDRGAWDAETLSWRLHRFLSMNFSADQAEDLAAARIWTGEVERWLAAGCTHAAAYAIAT